jgi:hypothetical protein
VQIVQRIGVRLAARYLPEIAVFYFQRNGAAFQFVLYKPIDVLTEQSCPARLSISSTVR